MALSEMDQQVIWDLARISSSFHLWERSRKDAEESGREILRQCKEALGWTQGELASRVDVNMYHLSRLMCGREKVSAALLARLHDVIIAEQGKQRGEGPDVDPGNGAGTAVPGDSAG